MMAKEYTNFKIKLPEINFSGVLKDLILPSPNTAGDV